MPTQLAIDFGTTNTVVARWNAARAAAEILALPDLSLAATDLPPLVPSLLYVDDGQTGRVRLGQAVLDARLERRPGPRLFRNFKRGIVSGEPLFRPIDGASWDDRAAGRQFLHGLLDALPCAPDEIGQLVLTVPVAAFTGYLLWLQENLRGIPPERIRLVDESTAAALGYAVTEPGALVLVLDFGGGTLDLSLVQLPTARSQTGGVLARLRRPGSRQPTAHVIAKAGTLLGGSDIDRWLLAEVAARAGLDPDALGEATLPLLARCEETKIALSSQESVSVALDVVGVEAPVTFTRAALEGLLDAHDFGGELERTVARVLNTARRQGIFDEDIHHVLLVGGTALMPAVRRQVNALFAGATVRADKPFTAVAEGALALAAGMGLDDVLPHSYGLRYLDPASGQPAYEEILAQGSRVPTPRPIEVTLGAAQDGQTALELVIGAIDSEPVARVDVRVEDGEVVFVAHTDSPAAAIRPLRVDPAALNLALDPPGRAGTPRLQAAFRVDADRRLRVTVTELADGRLLLDDAVLATLGEGDAETPLTEGYSLIPEDVEDLAAYFREQALTLALEQGQDHGHDHDHAHVHDQHQHHDHAPAESAEPVPAPEAGASSLSGREPALLGEGPARGLQRLSLRRLGGMLNVLPPEAITLDAAAAMLRSEEFYVRYSAAKALSRRADRAARQVMAAALEAGSPPTRASVARHLHGFSWYAGQPLVEHALADPDPRVREGAIYALCDWHDAGAYQRAAAVLHQAARDRDGDLLRAAAAWGLRSDQAAEAVPVLEGVLLAANPTVRVDALEALGVNGTPSAGAVVRRVITADADADVQYAAALSLVELLAAGCLPEFRALIDATRGTRRAAVLRAFFHATNYLHIDLAASAGIEGLLDALETALVDELPAARMAAVWPLAWLPLPRAADLLAAAYRAEGDPDVRAHMRRVTASLMSPAAARLAG